MSLHSRIKEARKNKGLTQTELGELIGVAKTTIAGYEKNREPTAAQLGEIADVLDVDVTFLLQDEIKQRRDTSATPYEMEHLVKKYRALDEHGKEIIDTNLEIEHKRCMAIEAEKQRQAAQAEADMEAAEETEPKPSNVIRVNFDNQKASAGSGFELDYERMQPWKVLYNELTRKADFCLEIEGNSMEPKFHSGDIILVRDQPAVDEGEIGLFIINSKGYVKKLGKDRLISINPEVDDVYLNEYDDIRCCGKVLGVLEPDWIVER